MNFAPRAAQIPICKKLISTEKNEPVTLPILQPSPSEEMPFLDSDDSVLMDSTDIHEKLARTIIVPCGSRKFDDFDGVGTENGHADGNYLIC